MATITAERGLPERLGASLQADGAHVAVFSAHATRIELCLFDPGGITEAKRLALPGRAGDVHFGFVPGLDEGALYGLRAHGPYDLRRGHRFDPSKLLVDPYALQLDRPFVYHTALGSPAVRQLDTAALVPRAVVCRPEAGAPVLPRRAPGFTYELLVRAYTQRHDGVPAELRGTLGGLAEPAVLDHLSRLGVETVELMPLTAAIDERHLVHLGLSNAWGYNPVCQMAPDPRLVPGGWAEVWRVTGALHARGIRVLLDMVLNHSGESDHGGPTLCYRGLDNATYYAADPDEPDRLVNDTGTGNTFAFWREPVIQLGIDALRAWVEFGGVDGFRYDLGTILARTPEGFRPDAPFLQRLMADPVLRDRLHVMEPWDIGPGGYQVGAFPAPFLEWQDRFRDDVRRFWRGEGGLLSALATRLAGSPDLFAGPGRNAAAGVNFAAAHDGFTLADIVAFADKHNEANGEGNRDGHGENHSWNNGVEGETDDLSIRAARRRDIRALLATLFVARGNPMIVMGDEMGRTQRGNNNAYAQDNETVWVDWAAADGDLAAFTARLATLRAAVPALHAPAFLTGAGVDGAPDVAWLGIDGAPMGPDDWQDGRRHWLGARMAAHGSAALVYLNAGRDGLSLRLPPAPPGRSYRLALASDRPDEAERTLDPDAALAVGPRSVAIVVEG
ncbi:glycogen debranching protein GlgX [Aureimonas sp. AU22]|uniref:glycogen debranching protein GlgX n=1 Tax=Aureimonas sp. AU22 TaxID=1638162 RepID=UPI0007866F8C|nr:glycogen debranching protein GlgX [Aureimonas sp. AU22]